MLQQFLPSIFRPDMTYHICGHTQTVSDAGYSGFSQGWGWGGTHAAGKFKRRKTTGCTSNRKLPLVEQLSFCLLLLYSGYGNVTISFNKIFNVMAKMKDGRRTMSCRHNLNYLMHKSNRHSTLTYYCTCWCPGGGIYVNGYTSDKYTNVMSHNWVDHEACVCGVLPR